MSNQFREFGELESVAFQPARSYAFVNFIDEGAAFAAFEALQGFVLAGNPLRIEFTKAVSVVYLRFLYALCICNYVHLFNLALSTRVLSCRPLKFEKDANQCPKH